MVNGKVGGSHPIPLAQRFWAKVAKGDGCWEWTAYRHAKGYGKIGVSGKLVYANRVSWELHYGPIPSGQWVLHRCDNPPCVRPDHLFLGTNGDNMVDMIRKRRGGSHIKLTPTDVVAIRAARAKGVPVRHLARQYGVDPNAIRCVVLRKSWAHVA